MENFKKVCACQIKYLNLTNNTSTRFVSQRNVAVTADTFGEKKNIDIKMLLTFIQT